MISTRPRETLVRPSFYNEKLGRSGTSVSNGYLAQSKEGRFTEVTSSNMQLNRIILTEPLLIFKFTESLVFKYYLTEYNIGLNGLENIFMFLPMEI